MSDKFIEYSCEFVATTTLTEVISLRLCFISTISIEVKLYKSSFSCLSNVSFALPHCIEFTIVLFVSFWAAAMEGQIPYQTGGQISVRPYVRMSPPLGSPWLRLFGSDRGSLSLSGGLWT